MNFKKNNNIKDYWSILFCFFFIIQPKIFTQYNTTRILYIIGNLFIFIMYIIKKPEKKIRIPKFYFSGQ